MPQEKKKRGRREEKKRKREDIGSTDYAEPAKRPRFGHEGYNGYGPEEGQTYGEHEAYAPYGQDENREIQFYGLLDEQEQAYFRQADLALDLDQFADSEEKDLFFNNLWKEAKGKELKIANSQSCSRMMERLIEASTSVQLKTLWVNFSTHFLNLFQHRFASHCCEALFRKTASLVTVEMSTSGSKGVIEKGPDGEELASMENLFLSCVKELDGNVGYLITDQFASHPLRVLLVILSGMPLDNTGTKSLLQSKRKEHNVSSKDIPSETRVVPESFQAAVQAIISGSTANLDTSNLRALATHPVANPVLQLLLTISLNSSSKQSALKDPRSLFRLLIPEDTPSEGTEIAAFINHLLYDPIGSRLLEVIITHVPGKQFKVLYRTHFAEKLSTLARNETASFVVTRIISRLSTADLENILPQLCTEIPTLIKRSRTTVLRALITRCQTRSVDITPIATALQTAYSSPPDLRQMLNFSSSSKTATATKMSTERQNLIQETTTDHTLLDNSLLLQTLLTTPGPLRTLATTAILTTDTPTLLEIASDRTTSRVLQAALTVPPSTSSNTTEALAFPREFIPPLLPHIITMAIDPVASHVVDALWAATSPPPLRFLREQIAAELVRGEKDVRGSLAGRAVWRNWGMDLFQRRRRDWAALTDDKNGTDGRGVESGGKREKTGIELARERHAQKRAKDEKRMKRAGGGGGNLEDGGGGMRRSVAQTA